jgi:hypothetical protein
MHSMSSMLLYITVSPNRNLTPTTVRNLLCWRHMQHCKLQQVALEHTHKMYIQKHVLEATLITQINL